MASLDVDKKAKKLATNDAATKSNKRKRMFEIKKVDQLDKLHLTFSKRKQSLFKKVTELSFLCEAKTALIISSPNGNFYTCGYPSPDTVIQGFLNPFSSKKQEKEEEKKVGIEDNIRVKYEEIEDQLKEVEKKLQVLREEHKSSSSFPSAWWNLSIEDMNLECLEEFKTSLERLKLNLVTAMEAKRFNSLEPLPLVVSSPPPAFSSNNSLLSECFSNQQEDHDFLQALLLDVSSPPALSDYSLLNEGFYDQQKNYDVAAASSSFMVPPPPPPTTTTVSNNSLLNECFLDQQQNYNVDAAYPSFMVPDGFGHYY